MIKEFRKEVIFMRKAKKMKTTLAIAALLIGSFGGQVLAATSGTTTATVGIQSGGLSITAPAVTSDFGNVTLTAGVVKPTATLGTLTLVDATGSGSGYKVNVSASQFTEVTPSSGWAPTTSAKKLPLSSLKIAAPSAVTPVGGTLSPAPKSSIGGLTVVDSGSPLKLLSAAANEGLGSYDVSFSTNSLELTVDVGTAQVDTTNYPGVPTPYSSTITWSIVTGP